MPASEYWDGDAYLVKLYQKAHELSNEQKNQELWMQGLYIHNAVGVVIQNAFKKKGETPAKYLDKPIRITPLTEKRKSRRSRSGKTKK